MMHISPFLLIGFCLGACTAHGLSELRRDLLVGSYFTLCGLMGWAGIFWLIVWKP